MRNTLSVIKDILTSINIDSYLILYKYINVWVFEILFLHNLKLL